MDDRGLLLVLSGPSGVGKGTVCKALRERMPDLVYSVSATTRAPRAGEVEGVNYFFKSKEEFRRMIEQDELLEWAEYVGNYYGTPRQFVVDMLEQGRDVILEIEVQGALQVKKKFPQGVFLFLAPPDLAELENRIVGRGTETEETIRHRMEMARQEIELMDQYDYVVVNDMIECACERIQSIITAEHLKKERQIHKYRKWLEEVT
ncbi:MULTISPECIES: guanylate kinase [Bacillales]|jgi:guanylate kinase|uniref:Guanylate kinase n=1 Tax=Brevibacillus aydinogluensis TaxID=927786 RepID=A0AA48M6A8_9BACL|nr:MULTISPECIES: guanylate kinase [Bacillales]REK62955.1 MAG: guanylate kinase [Brevibacillus sp.]MBR8658205.1 guanylate kinase [Brevibacillus sp. NL20B1]MDT3414759.1 guanylate kinase [Brevibacillus aydinogluensis]NNV01454.1 guanylate kinase [Brevibacillus sp. MCWH]UFJ61109.1 guanylate kinase [Anoxybacillus sediminis]